MSLQGNVHVRHSDGEKRSVGRLARKSATASCTSKEPSDSQEEANKIWDAIQTIPDWRNEIVADIKVTGAPRKHPASRRSIP